MSIKYKGFTIEKTKGTEFGKPTFIKYGKEYDIQDYIESGREDTEIYPCLAKYGCLKPMEITANEIYGDFTEYNDLRTTIEKGKKLRSMWDKLPVDIKNQFNNDPGEFVDRGMQWAQNQMKSTEKPAEPVAEQPAEPKGE